MKGLIPQILTELFVNEECAFLVEKNVKKKIFVTQVKFMTIMRKICYQKTLKASVFLLESISLFQCSISIPLKDVKKSLVIEII